MVNAQITAMISLLEAIANIATAIIIFLAIRSTFYTMLLPMIVYLIILPIAFLMNTSDNKHRIVEAGWKNIFLNVAGKKHFVSRFCHATSAPSSLPSASNSENIHKCHNRISTIFNTTTDKEVENNKGNKGKSITVLSHSTSSHYLKIRSQKTQNKMDALDVMDLPKVSIKQETFQELISKMHQALNDEETYIDIFRKFVRLVEESNNRYNLNNDFEAHPSRENVFQRRAIKAKNFQKISTRFGRKSDKSGVGMVQSNESNNNIVSKQTCLKGQEASRRKIRNKVIGKLKSLEVDNESFKLWAEKLINVEESFIK